MRSILSRLGAWVTGGVVGLGQTVNFGASVLRSALVSPLRGRQIVAAIYDSGVLSLALLCASGATVGFVLGLQLYYTLSRFGAESSLGTAVGLALIRELGPVLTGLLVTGRAGSATCAEIGSMKATDQLDGLRMMAIDPIHYVVMPRALGIIIVMPLLSALFVIFGIGGAYLIGVELLGLDGGSYISGLESAVTFREDVLQSIVKSVIFGVLLALISTYRGYSCAPNAVGVSRATTSTVVTTSVCILLADFVLTSIWGV